MMFYVMTQTRAIPLYLELAVTPDERAQGLMYRTHLEDLHGMLFIYGQPTHASMWMRNTFVDLDVLFLDTTGRIQCIRQAYALDETSVSCRPPVLTSFVIELPLGTCKRYGIRQGDKVQSGTSLLAN